MQTRCRMTLKLSFALAFGLSIPCIALSTDLSYFPEYYSFHEAKVITTPRLDDSTTRHLLSMKYWAATESELAARAAAIDKAQRNSPEYIQERLEIMREAYRRSQRGVKADLLRDEQKQLVTHLIQEKNWNDLAVLVDHSARLNYRDAGLQLSTLWTTIIDLPEHSFLEIPNRTVVHILGYLASDMQFAFSGMDKLMNSENVRMKMAQVLDQAIRESKDVRNLILGLSIKENTLIRHGKVTDLLKKFSFFLQDKYTLMETEVIFDHLLKLNLNFKPVLEFLSSDFLHGLERDKMGHTVYTKAKVRPEAIGLIQKLFAKLSRRSIFKTDTTLAQNLRRLNDQGYMPNLKISSKSCSVVFE